MGFITYQAFQKHLQGKNTAPVYLFAGDEQYFIDSCLKSIEAKLAVDPLNREVFQAPDLEGKTVSEAVQTLPFLGDKRLIILKLAHKLNNPDYDFIEKLIENPVDTTCFVILIPEKPKEVKKRKDLIELCTSSKACVAVDCKKIYDSEAVKFVKAEFSRRKKLITDDLAERIVDETGADLMSLSNEIEKICIYLGNDNNKVSEETFLKISGWTKEINDFALGGEIEAKNLKESLFILEKMLIAGEEHIKILFQISSTVRKLLMVKSLIEEKNYNPLDAASAARIYNSYFASIFLRNISKYKLAHLKACIPKILAADIAMKTKSQHDKTLLLENLIIFICG